MNVLHYFKGALGYSAKLVKVIILKDAWEYLNSFRTTQIIASVFVNIADAGSKLLGPAAFAKAVTMAALDKAEDEVWGVSVTATDLLYIAVALNGLQLITPDIRKLVLYGVSEHIFESVGQRLASKSLRLPGKECEGRKFEVFALWSGANNEVSSYISTVAEGIHPILLNLVIGSSLCGYYFGAEAAGVSLGYIAFSGVVLNNLLAYLTKLPESTRQNQEAFSRLFYNVQESIENYETVKLFNREGFEEANITHRLREYTAAKKNNMLKEMLWLTQSGVSLLTQFLLAWHIAKDGFKSYEIDEVIFLFNYINNVGSAMNSINYSIRFGMVISNFFEKKLRPFLSLKEEGDEDESPYDVAIDLENQERLPFAQILRKRCAKPMRTLFDKVKPISIEFCRVSFSYPDKEVLKDVSFFIGPGSMAAIVGGTNSGKSTIFNLLCKYISPHSGIIKINGVNIKDIPEKELREMLGFVKQKIELFEADSLEYNILYSCLSEKRLLELKKANQNAGLNKNSEPILLKEEKAVFDEATDKARIEHLRERNLNQCRRQLLAGGEEQRIGIARILARQSFFSRRSNILIYDEPTSSLDAITESEVLSNIHKLGRGNTIFMAAHRLATIKNFPQILVLKDGRIEESGTHESLVKKGGYYASMYEKQCL